MRIAPAHLLAATAFACLAGLAVAGPSSRFEWQVEPGGTTSERTVRLVHTLDEGTTAPIAFAALAVEVQGGVLPPRGLETGEGVSPSGEAITARVPLSGGGMQARVTVTTPEAGVNGSFADGEVLLTVRVMVGEETTLTVRAVADSGGLRTWDGKPVDEDQPLATVVLRQ